MNSSRGSEMLKGFKELYSRDQLLTMTGILHVLVFFCMVSLIFMDSRLLLGINIWIKPMKFALSIAVYTLTLAVIMKYVRNRAIQKIVSYITSIGFILEMIIIIFQAAQGKKSHFNFDTPLDITIFSIMGVIIGIVTIALIILFIHLVRNKIDLPHHYALALKSGLFISIVGALIGGYMSSHSKHTVNGDDGGPGLFVLNWSTLVGDWRVAHFFGLHALQCIPLLTFILTNKLHNEKSKTRVTWAISILYASFVLFTFIEAAYGKPLIKT
ncbi:MAG: hypothetical protein JWM44_2394 [Bacilli bacterium]|nr:hypothetical protein [Bacilli bacterium]